MRRIVRKGCGGVNRELSSRVAAVCAIAVTGTDWNFGRYRRDPRRTVARKQGVSDYAVFMSHDPQGFASDERGNSRVGLATAFVVAAGRRAIRFVYEDVIVAGGADHAVDRFTELVVRRGCGVFGTRLFATDGHGVGSGSIAKTF
jgi:hypothetical protein